VNICNGFFAENATAAAALGGMGLGCTGSSYPVPILSKPGFGALIPAGKRAALPFSGTIDINRVVASRVNSNGISGPVATVYLDAYTTSGARLVSTAQRFGFNINADTTGDYGYTATA